MTRTLIKKCPNCGKEFKTFLSINQICCAKECAYEYQSKQHFIKNKKQCIVCGKEFIPKHNKSKGLCCSYKCSGQSRRLERIYRNGYWSIKAENHPNATKQGYIMEHRLIMEKHIGRYLDKKEVVHHINHNSLDNRIDNLMLYPSGGKHAANEHVKRNNDNGKFSKDV